MKLMKLAAALGLLQAALASAAPPAAQPAGAHDGARLHGIETSRALPPDRRAPALPVDREGHALQAPSRAMSAQAVACNPSEFESLSGGALVNKVRSCDIPSLNQLYGLSGSSAYYVFQESKMVSVAWAFRDAALYYPGNNSTQAQQLVTFLRAGYYVQYYNPASVGQYGTALRTAITAALDAFFSNGNSMTVSDANGDILRETIILVDSSTTNARYLNRMIDVLNRFDNSWLASWYMRAAANSVYTVTFRGHQNADFRTLIQSDQRIIDALYNFHNRWTSLLGTDNSYLTGNAARELARFVQHVGTVRNKVRPLARDLLQRSSMTGPTAPVYIGVAEMVDYYDKDNCSYYGTCNFRQQLESTVLPISYNCSATLKIRAQQMTSAQLASTCATQAAEETRFHSLLETGRVPVAGDRNDDLEMVVFDSSNDYRSYAGVLFGIDTNNGGMYLEGDPTNASNQARFIAYEAEWLRPDFRIWNLEHEYIHYLDGRFNMAGSFSTYLTANTIWYIEGLAEYVPYLADNPTAVDAVRNRPHVSLSTIWRNTYSSGTERVYRWGYFAVRFMFERHRGELRNIIDYFRAGSYATYDSYLLSTIGSRYDSEFQSWMTNVLGGGTNQPPVANFTFSASGLTVSFTDASSDSDGTIASRSWDFGDGTSSPATNPSKTYAAAGTYTVRLTVTDNRGATRSTTRQVTVGGGTSLPECTASDTRQLGQNCARSNRAKSVTGHYDYMFVLLPAGVSQLRITVSGGTGNADLYVNSGTWATTGTYQYSSRNAGNNETVTFANPPSGWLYISLHAASPFSGVRVTTEY